MVEMRLKCVQMLDTFVPSAIAALERIQEKKRAIEARVCPQGRKSHQ